MFFILGIFENQFLFGVIVVFGQIGLVVWMFVRQFVIMVFLLVNFVVFRQVQFGFEGCVFFIQQVIDVLLFKFIIFDLILLIDCQLNWNFGGNELGVGRFLIVCIVCCWVLYCVELLLGCEMCQVILFFCVCVIVGVKQLMVMIVSMVYEMVFSCFNIFVFFFG